MAGIEVAGIILAFYPVIGDALTAFRAAKYGGAPKRFLRSLEVEQVIFADFVHKLLASELSEKDLDLLRNGNPADLEIWKNIDLLQKVDRRLGPRASKTVLNTLRDINEVLKSLRNVVASIAVNKEGEFTDDSRFQGRFHGRLMKIKHGLPLSSIRMNIEELRAHNGTLQRLLCDRTIHLPIQTEENLPQRIRYLQRDCSHAIDLYHALCSSFQCECTRPHPANLRVHRLVYDKGGRKRRNMGDDDGQFELLFSLGEEEEHEDAGSLEMETSWSPSPPSERSDISFAALRKRRMSSMSIQEYAASEILDPQESIDDLCGFVKSLEGNPTVAKASLNFPGTQEKNYLISMTPPRGNASTAPTILCVNDFLTANDLPLSREDRMGLALRLSHAVLQFYSTPWIDDNWTWRDFAFAERGETSDGKHDTSQLFLARNFYSASKTSGDSDISDSATHSSHSFTWPEPILTRLGFALIELALGARFSDLRGRDMPELRRLVQPNLNDPWMNAEILDRETARLLVQSGLIRREEGQAFEDAVKACLDHQYIHESMVKGLKSNGPSFQEDVEQCILAPLYDMWDKSWGNS